MVLKSTRIPYTNDLIGKDEEIPIKRKSDRQNRFVNIKENLGTKPNQFIKSNLVCKRVYPSEIQVSTHA